MSRKKLVKGLWQSERYYHEAKKGSLDTKHPGMRVLKKLAKNSKSILDLGCGEGTRLNLIVKRKRNEAVGVDISKTAIKLAKESYPKLRFIWADLENLPFEDNTFDLAYNAFVLEHLENPGKVINETIRVIKKGANLVFIAPNFGSPNRASPPFKGSRLKKLLKGVIFDLARPFIKVRKLGWNKVEPIINNKRLQIDFDATVEPYLGSLVEFLGQQDLKIIMKSSCWGQELPNAEFHQKLFSLLARLGLYPFVYWGPHLVVVAKK